MVGHFGSFPLSDCFETTLCPILAECKLETRIIVAFLKRSCLMIYRYALYSITSIFGTYEYLCFGYRLTTRHIFVHIFYTPSVSSLAFMWPWSPKINQ